MMDIPNHFCGYLKVEGNAFAFSVQDHMVRLLPAEQDGKDVLAALRKLNRLSGNPQYLRGKDEFGNEIAFLIQGIRTSPGMAWSASAGVPIIVKSCGNMSGFYDVLSGDWGEFDAISFSGGALNAVYNPKIAALKRRPWSEIREAHENFDGARTIEIKPFAEYTKSIPVLLDNQNINMTISVFQSCGEGDLRTGDLGRLVSFMRLEFEIPQPFTKIAYNYAIIRKLLALLVRQNNVNFEVALYQRNSVNKLMKTAVCRINDRYEDYCEKSFHNVMSLSQIFPYLPGLVKIICQSKNNCNHILATLPESNKGLGRITISNVQALCTALEIEYRAAGYKPTKDPQITELKSAIAATIKAFLGTNPGFDVHNKTTISTAYKNLDYSLTERIFHLYSKHEDAVDEIVDCLSAPKITLETIRDFVQLRNAGTHDEGFGWGDNGRLYIPLLALAYLCLLERAGISREVREAEVKRISV